MIFTSPFTVDIPQQDILTFLFQSTRFQDSDPVWIDPEGPDVVITKGRARELTRQIGRSLRDRGIGRNAPGKDVVIHFVENQVMIAPTAFGILCAEGICATCPPTATAFELARQLGLSSPKILICSPQTQAVAKAALQQCTLDQLPELLIMDSSSLDIKEATTGRSILDDNRTLEWRAITDHETLAERTACLIYSSGTTGLPKGVQLSHANFIANISQIMWHFEPRYQRIRSENRFPAMPAVLPNANAAGVILHTMLPLAIGWQIYPVPKYDLPLLISYIKRLQFSVLFLAPAIWQRIVNEYSAQDVRSIRYGMSGGSLLTNTLRSAMSDMFVPGISVITNWGMTEATCTATQFPLHEIDTEESVGRLMPNMSAKVIDTMSGKVLGKNQLGELCIKGPNITGGYFNNPTATAEAFTNDGFFKTGDIAVVNDDEKVFIKGRYKELIKYKSNQVPPVELESVILTIPGVKDVGVIGVPQGDGNELPRAYVVREDDHQSLTAETITDQIEFTLANHKWLRGGVRWVDEIPRNPIGKIDRKIIKTWCEGDAPSHEVSSKAKL